jgi:ankyrin repeat protein
MSTLSLRFLTLFGGALLAVRLPFTISIPLTSVVTGPELAASRSSQRHVRSALQVHNLDLSSDPAQEIMGEQEMAQDKKGPQSANMHLGRIDANRVARLVELAVQHGADRQDFLDRLRTSTMTEIDPAVLFMWMREWPEMKDHDDLLLAAKVRATDLALILLNSGANPNSKASDGTSALIYASQNNLNSLARSLISAGADANAHKNDGETALFIAAQQGNLEIVQSLIAAGADIKAARNDGRTVLMAAASGGNLRIVQSLIVHGADVLSLDGAGSSALMSASGPDAGKISEVLLERGADVNTRSNDGAWSPLLLSAVRRSSASLRALLSHGADANASVQDGRTALHFVTFDKQEFLGGDIDCIQILLNAGANPNTYDKLGQTPLMNVAEYGDGEAAEALLEHGADPAAKNRKGETILAIAQQSGQRDVIEALHKFGVKE